MGRLPFALALLGLLFARTASGAPSTEAVVSKPSLVCPQGKLGNEDLQAQYEKAWKQFTAEVDQATKSLEAEIGTRFTEAQKAGHLDLALMWDGMKKQFNQLSELRWDSAKEKKTWKQRFGDADFPDDLSALLKGCDQDYKSARERLEEGYKNIESALTKAGNLEQALKVRSELKAVLAGEPAPQPAPPTEPLGKPQPANESLLKRLQGEWTNPNRGERRFFHKDGKFSQARVTGGESVPPLTVVVENQKATWRYPNGFRAEAWLIGDDLIAFLFRNADGSVNGDGEVWFRAK